MDFIKEKCLLGYDTPIIVGEGAIWHCTNLDLLAPIDDEGICYRLSNGECISVWDSDKTNEARHFVEQLRWANEEEQKQFCRIAFNGIFEGDKVVVVRGRKMVGETKIVKGYFKYQVKGTYGHQDVDYLIFEDGTKVNVNHCDIVGITYKKSFYQDKELFWRMFLDKKSMEVYLTPRSRIG